MLKILGGTARGRVLKSGPKHPALRPILARVKKSLFDILYGRVPNSRFLDLFAGTGAVGLEALSRGASHVAFVEKDRRSIHLLKENLAKLGFDSRARIYQLDATANLRPVEGPFHLIFLGPPYKEELVSETLAQIAGAGLLAAEGVIIAQHHKKESIRLPSETEVFRNEKYGDTSLTFIRKNKS